MRTIIIFLLLTSTCLGYGFSHIHDDINDTCEKDECVKNMSAFSHTAGFYIYDEDGNFVEVLVPRTAEGKRIWDKIHGSRL